MQKRLLFCLEAILILYGVVIANSYITTIVEARKMCLYTFIPTTKWDEYPVHEKLALIGYLKNDGQTKPYYLFDELFRPPFVSKEEREQMYCHYNIRLNGNVVVYAGTYSKEQIKHYQNVKEHQKKYKVPVSDFQSSSQFTVVFESPSSRRGGDDRYYEGPKFIPETSALGSTSQDWLENHPAPHFVPNAWINRTLETLFEVIGILRPIDETELELVGRYYTYADWKAAADPEEVFRQHDLAGTRDRPFLEFLDGAFRFLGI